MQVVVCGSMSHAKRMVELESELHALGHKVILPVFTHEYARMHSLDHIITESARNKVQHDLIRDYYGKIRDSEGILVANEEKNGVQGYIGGNAFLEMGFAYVLEKQIYLLRGVPDIPYADEIWAMEPIVLHGDLSRIQ